MAKPFKLLIFDWDGTLMDSQARIVESFRAAIREVGTQPRSEQEIRQIVGLGLPEGIASLCQDATPQQCNELVRCYRNHYFSPKALPTPLFPNATETIRQLHQAGYWLAVATGKGRRGLDEALEESGLKPFFHVTRCAEETISKPHPQMLEEIMLELAMSPADSVMIGDSEFDLLMAKNAGMASIAVSYGVQDKTRLLAHKPLTCLDNIADLLPWLEYDNVELLG